MNSNIKKLIAVGSVAGMLGGMMVIQGWACSDFKSLQPAEQLNLSSVGEGEIEVIANSKTTSTVYSEQMLESMKNVTGVNPVSNATTTAYNAKKGTISEDGAANTLNAPMMMSVVTVGSEICRDLVNKERALASDQRRFFNGVNFTVGPNTAYTPAVLLNSIEMLALSFWGRYETDTELALINAGVAEVLAANTQNNGTATENLFIYLCSAMISTLDAIEM